MQFQLKKVVPIKATSGSTVSCSQGNHTTLFIFRSVTSENQKKIVLDEYSADITLLTTLISDYQLNTLSFMMEQLLTNKNSDRCTLPEMQPSCRKKSFLKTLPT